MIEVDVVTPGKQLVRGARVNALKLPASTGEMEVLPGHVSLITLLGTGTLSFVQDHSERKFAVSYGFAEIHQDRVLIMAETCEEAGQIDVDRARRAERLATERLAGTLSREEFAKYERKLRRALIREKTHG